MGYLALYRKYRPQTFDNVIGQNHITTSLINQIKNNSISHAYLFCGTRGTGKTSIAKIFAKSINCENPVNGSACGKCKTCLALNDTANLDIMEIDAASNNRVDEIRDLREKVKYPPINGKYKVYIIDEVHMLTDSAFNALLKTLEEPPQYVVFILATTEVQKLPATILSRCLRFDFKLVGQEELEQHIKKIFDLEKISYENSAISLIARLGEGSVRDTLSIADMCVAYSNRNVTYSSVLEAVGSIDKNVISDLANYILKGDYYNLLSKIDVILQKGKNVNQLAKDMANYFRDLAVIKTCENYTEILKYPTELRNKMVEDSNICDINNILKSLKIYASLENDFRLTNNPRMVFEVASLNLCDEINKLNNNEQQNIETKPAIANEKVETKKNENKNNIENATTNQKESDLTNIDDKMLFGKVLVGLREKNEIMLISLIGENVKYNLKDNVLTLFSNNENEYKIISKENTLKVLNDTIKQIDEKFSVKVEYNKQDDVSIVESLKNKFGNDIKII